MIFWLDRAGKVQPLHLAPGFYFSPRFSPDGKRLAFSMYISPVEGNVWVKDLERGTTSGLTSLPGHNTSQCGPPTAGASFSDPPKEHKAACLSFPERSGYGAIVIATTE